jgi:RNA-directed DNA polymerase
MHRERRKLYHYCHASPSGCDVSRPERRVAALNAVIRGWAAYFNQGPVIRIYETVRWYTERRLRRWLMDRRGRRGTGYRQYSDEYLYGKLGLYSLPRRRADLPSAKA